MSDERAGGCYGGGVGVIIVVAGGAGVDVIIIVVVAAAAAVVVVVVVVVVAAAAAVVVAAAAAAAALVDMIYASFATPPLSPQPRDFPPAKLVIISDAPQSLRSGGSASVAAGQITATPPPSSPQLRSPRGGGGRAQSAMASRRQAVHGSPRRMGRTRVVDDGRQPRDLIRTSPMLCRAMPCHVMQSSPGPAMPSSPVQSSPGPAHSPLWQSTGGLVYFPPPLVNLPAHSPPPVVPPAGLFTFPPLVSLPARRRPGGAESLRRSPAGRRGEPAVRCRVIASAMRARI
ncbi:unnamed protein product [Diplocarpon coronariae]